MKINELRNLNDDELYNELLATRKEQFNLRVQKANGEISKPHLFERARRKIARIKTLMTERMGGSE